MKQLYRSASPEKTEQIARDLAKEARPGDFYALYGDLGAGKTVFVRGFVAALLPDAVVTSPTYAILNVYEGNGVKINHLDTYRITSEDDLESTGFYEALPGCVTLCEWAEKIDFALPTPRWEIRFDKGEGRERTLAVERIEA